jgi:hypothetical protein
METWDAIGKDAETVVSVTRYAGVSTGVDGICSGDNYSCFFNGRRASEV